MIFTGTTRPARSRDHDRFPFGRGKIAGGVIVAKRERVRLDDQIRSPEVRVISPDGEQMGIMTIAKARETASEMGLDLVEVAANSKPPVCRIMDYGKYKYLQSKRLQGGPTKKQSTVQVKEVKLRPNTESHDLEYKVKNAKRFLQDGNKVKVTMVFRGRELSHVDIGGKNMQKVKEMIGDEGVVEREPKLEGRMMVMIFAPPKSK